MNNNYDGYIQSTKYHPEISYRKILQIQSLKLIFIAVFAKKNVIILNILHMLTNIDEKISKCIDLGFYN